MKDDEARSMIIRAAWLYYVEGLTQQHIADRIGVSKPKVNRLVAQAHAEGLITVFVERLPEDCLELESRLCERYELATATVIPVREEVDPLRSIALVGAQHLTRLLAHNSQMILGLGHGRTLAALAEQMPRQNKPQARMVSLLGSMTRRAAVNPFDVVYKLSELTQAEGYVLPAPLVVDREEDRAMLLEQNSLKAILDLAARAHYVLAGIGDLGPESYWEHVSLLSAEELQALRGRGAVANILGNFYDARGEPVECEVSRRLVAVDPAAFENARLIAIAGGMQKQQAIHAALRTGLLSGLISDEHTARAVLAT